jgi:N-acetylneuraminic acid mutarotase
VWEELTTSPYQRSGCTAINGKLVIASGLSEQDKTTTTIHCFSPDKRKWVELGEMPAARSSCSLAVIDGDQIVVVGGYVNPRNWMGSLTTDIMATVNLKVPL